MSRASADFYFDDGSRLYGIYCGTVDVLNRIVLDTPHAPWSVYYDHCHCLRDQPEPVSIRADYRGNDLGKFLFCPRCLCRPGERRAPSGDYREPIRLVWPDGSFSFGARRGGGIAGWSVRNELQAAAYCSNGCVNPEAHGLSHEDVVVHVDYGDGFEWLTRLCTQCGIVIGNVMSFPEDEIEPMIVKAPPKRLTPGS